MKPGRTARAKLLLLAAPLTACAVGFTSTEALAAAGGSGTQPARHGVREVHYNLGDEAFHPPKSLGYVGNNELNGAVYYPDDLSSGTHPLIMIEHGLWDTCADAGASASLAAAQAALAKDEKNGDKADAAKQEAIIKAASDRLSAWPCASGVRQIPSYLGYDYLGRDLASQGFVVVSIGANGINSTSSGQADTVYQERAALINAQLRMWQQLSSTGKGPLRGSLVDAKSGRPSPVNFKNHVDVQNVGLMGHSMGGGGVMQEIADSSRGTWPKGVSIKAAFALAPTATWDVDPITKTSFAVMWGTCDQVNTGEYFAWNKKDNSAPIAQYTVRGGVHDFYNKQWSPSSGQVSAHDDAIPGSKPGTCTSQFPGTTTPQTDQKELSEQQQRRITKDYVNAYFSDHLLGRTQYEPYLTGKKPFPGTGGAVSTQFDGGIN
ncbi:alpha/beta hydrolase [Streptomyces sp. NPDC059398]|uniref:poly(ethylene terephthalate) hydrolase family protein n=1 Tax=Streptomyces sp. NPDC059398 TaxID=3346820 RepID=UPI00368E9A0A